MDLFEDGRRAMFSTRLINCRSAFEAFTRTASMVGWPSSTCASRRPCPQTKSYKCPHSSGDSLRETLIGLFKPTALMLATMASHLSRFRRSEEHTSELQSHHDLVCRLLLEKKKQKIKSLIIYPKKKNQTTQNK